MATIIARGDRLELPLRVVTGIVAIGRMAKKPIIQNDGILIAPMLPYSLTHDHRIVDGAAAEHFLHAFKKAIENPSPEIGELVLA